MESAGIWIALIAAVIVWALIREKKKYKERQQESTNWNSSSETWPPRKEKTLVDDSWRSEPATDKQLDYIESLGGRVPARGLTKGEASDRITKLQPIDPDDAAVLRYFGLSTQEQTRDSVARVAEALLNDEAHKKAWGERPPSQEKWSRSFEQLSPVAKRDHRGYAACICANGNAAKYASSGVAWLCA